MFVSLWRFAQLNSTHTHNSTEQKQTNERETETEWLSKREKKTQVKDNNKIDKNKTNTWVITKLTASCLDAVQMGV